MGLNCSHGAFDGAYSAFNRLRKYVAAACGGSWPPHGSGSEDADGKFVWTPHPNPEYCDDKVWYYEPEVVPEEVRKGMLLFLGHSDCDGELSPDQCREVSKFLCWVAAVGPPDETWGHPRPGRICCSDE
jgi:hypothetical protein